MVKNIIFDLGGVIITINPQEGMRRFHDMGIKDAEKLMDPYTQQGIFGDLEGGRIDAATFRKEASRLAGHELSFADCKHGWLGYLKDVPQRNLDLLRQLHREGYRLILLSNTNPFMMSWAESGDFGEGYPLHDYFDAEYKSYEVRMLKPDPDFFRYVLAHEQVLPEDCLYVDDGPRNVAAASELGMRTFCPKNGSDWTAEIREYLK